MRACKMDARQFIGGRMSLLAGWNITATSANASVFLWADFVSATGGTTARTFEINSKAS